MISQINYYLAPVLSRKEHENYTYVDPEQFLGKLEYANFWRGHRADTVEYFDHLKRYYTYEIYPNKVGKCFKGLPGLCHDMIEGNEKSL